jgi:hypothetical protein
MGSTKSKWGFLINAGIGFIQELQPKFFAAPHLAGITVESLELLISEKRSNMVLVSEQIGRL